MNRATVRIVLFLVLVVMAPFAVAGTGCSSKKADPAPTGGKRGGLRQAAFPVEILKVEAKPEDLVVAAPGVVDAFERIQITARVSGVVDKVTFAEGQDVKPGQAMAYIDSRRYSLSVSSSRAAVAKTEATAADTEQSLGRRQKASETNPGLIPGEEIETYQTKLRTAQADVDQAKEALKLAQLNLEDSTVKAPVDGVVQTRSVETGQYVQAGTVIATLLQREPMLLRFNVTTSEAPRLKVGMDVDFTLKESQQTYKAKITLVAGAADAESRLVPVTAQVVVDKGKFWLRPGSFAQVQIKLTPQRQFPMIPQTAARPSDHGFLAYIIQGDTAHERTLQLGLHTIDGWVEVKDGLSVGDQLVTRGVEALAEGTKVTISTPGAAGSASGASSAAPHEHRAAPQASAEPGSTAQAAADPGANDSVPKQGGARRHGGGSVASAGSAAPSEAP